MIQFLLPHVLTLAGTVLTGVAAWLGAQLVAWVRAKTHSEKAAELTGQVNETAADAISWVAAQLKAGIIEVARDGKVTPAEAQRLQDLAVAKLREWLGAHFPERAELLLGITAPLLQEWLRGVVQKQFQLRLAPPSID